jgi:hypothetical protein
VTVDVIRTFSKNMQEECFDEFAMEFNDSISDLNGGAVLLKVEEEEQMPKGCFPTTSRANSAITPQLLPSKRGNERPSRKVTGCRERVFRCQKGDFHRKDHEMCKGNSRSRSEYFFIPR